MNLLGSQYEWNFANPFTPMALGVGIFVLVLMAVFSVRAYRIRKPAFWVLPAGARFMAVGLLGLCISQPNLKSTRTIVHEGRVVILLDTSRSMSLADLPGGRTRIEQACRLLNGEDAALPDDLSGKFKVDLFTFSEEANSLPEDSLREVTADGGVTNISQALLTASDRPGSSPMAGIVLISDGQDNGSADVVKIAQAGVPIFSIGIGARQEVAVKDLALTNLKVEQTAEVGSTVVVELAVRSQGISAVAPLSLKSAGKEIANGLASVKPDTSETVRLSFVARQPGQFGYTVSTPAVKDELTAENNRLSFIIQVINRSYRVLYIEGTMRWEYKFLRRTLSMDKDILIESYLRVGPNRFFHQAARGTEAETQSGEGGALPLIAGALKNFDLIILGDITAEQFGEKQLRFMADYVQGGGALLMLGGKQTLASGGYAGTPIEKALPVHIKPVGDVQADGEFRPILTAVGARHPTLQLSPNPDENSSLWASLPALAGSNRVGEAKPGASVLLVRRSTRRIFKPDVILAVQRYGKGKSAVLSVDTTWHWDFESLGSGGDSTAYQQFWSQLVRWLMPDPADDPRNGQPIRLATDKQEYRVTEPIHIEARVTSSSESAPDLKVTLIGPDGAESPMSLEKSGEAGRYETVFTPRAAGQYQVSAELHSGSEILGTDAASFLVGEASIEMERTDLNEELLTTISQISRGAYYTPGNCKELINKIPVVKKEVVKTQRIRLWSSPLLLVCFIAFAAAEWTVRRYAVGDS